ncbi:hypothetical protein NQZ68_009921 [Dissostichus eleginoides]|nr:hypothetical protein NQZ68_009921 [Dissostichus eleginoides]
MVELPCDTDFSALLKDDWGQEAPGSIRQTLFSFKCSAVSYLCPPPSASQSASVDEKGETIHRQGFCDWHGSNARLTWKSCEGE